MRGNKVRLNPDKMEVSVMGNGCPVMLDGGVSDSPQKDLLDPAQILNKQVASVGRSGVCPLQLRPVLDKKALAFVIPAWVTLRLDYCNTLLCGASFGDITETSAHTKCSRTNADGHQEI